MKSESSDVPLFANLSDNDPALIKSVDEAKRTLPQFLKAYSKRQFPSATYCVKVPFIDLSKARKQAVMRTTDTITKYPKSPICYLWLIAHSVLGDLTFCHVAEAPKELKLPPGTTFVVSGDSIEDWMINHDGTVFGGFSLRVMRARLDKKDQAKFDSHTGIRAFKKLES